MFSLLILLKQVLLILTSMFVSHSFLYHPDQGYTPVLANLFADWTSPVNFMLVIAFRDTCYKFFKLIRPRYFSGWNNLNHTTFGSGFNIIDSKIVSFRHCLSIFTKWYTTDRLS
jgi:hypothetical protein